MLEDLQTKANDLLHCQHSSTCSGCAWISTPYSQQSTLKSQHLKDAWRAAGGDSDDIEDIAFHTIARGGLRDRVDLVFDHRTGEPRLGLFNQARNEIVAIENCPQLSKNLQHWLTEALTHFAKLGALGLVSRGSLRLRVSPQNERGIWLDFSNVDIKVLLDQREILNELRAHCTVEIGQRHKALTEIDGLLKLRDPILKPWFETYDSNGNSIPLFGTIAGFTQPGFEANKILVKTVLEKVRRATAKPQKIVEFGSGIGNFTLPLASLADEVTAYELDKLSCESLLNSAASAGLESKIKIEQGDFQRLSANRMPAFESIDCIVVDPPRSGLKSFLDPLQDLAHKPLNFIYISCFAQSFAQDAQKLKSFGYQLRSVDIVDQFPQSPHYELVAHFGQ